MSQQSQQDHISKKRVVYTMPGVDAVHVRRDQVYRETHAGPLTLDLYYPPDSPSQLGVRTPAVVFVTGFADAGAQAMLGCKLKDMASYISWGELAAASGLIAITYTNDAPATDIHGVLEYVRRHAAELHVDEDSIGLWACSGNAPAALAVLMTGAHRLKCAVLCYPYLLDLDGATGVAQAARQFGFVNPGAGKSVADLPPDTALFLVRAGEDRMPGLNDALDSFVAAALRRNLPITLANHAAAPHAFDLFDDTDASREMIRHMLTFLVAHLRT